MIMYDAATQKRREFIQKVSRAEDERVKHREQVRLDNQRKLAGNWSYQGLPKSAAHA
jgi:hypothetical protein